MIMGQRIKIIIFLRYLESEIEIHYYKPSSQENFWSKRVS